MKKLAILACITALATGAFAHSEVDTTTPENGATMGEVPDEIGLTFAKDIRLTRVEMVHQNHPAVDLDLGAQTRFDRAFTLPLQGLGTGTYRIDWRGLSVDGHAMKGTFSFTVE